MFETKAKIATPAQKTSFNTWMFTVAASRYDWATRCMSLGQDGTWKQELLEMIPPPEGKVQMSFLDLACGTGDIALAIKRKYPESRVEGIDLTECMLGEARKRPDAAGVIFTQGDMCSLPVESHSVDVITGSYALRNAGDLDRAIGEVARVLKPHGRAVFLDFNKMPAGFLSKAQYWVIKFWGAFWGVVFHFNPSVHSYIADSLSQFPSGLDARFKQHGLELERDRKMVAGSIRLWGLKKN